MVLTASQIAGILEGEVEGNPEITVHKVAKIEEGEKGALTFLSNSKYTPFIYSTKASITLVSKGFIPEQKIDTTLIKVDNAYESFSKLLEYYETAKKARTGIEQPSFMAKDVTYGSDLYLAPFAYVGANVVLGNGVKIYPNAYIGENVSIGNNVVILAGAKVNSESVIGNNCVIHSGVIIGSDGFGFAPNNEGEFTKIPQTGNVVIEDNVDIGSNTTIDRATMGSTIIRKGVKLDNQIQIGHGVEIGENTVIAAQTGIAGSTKIGKRCMIGGQVGIVGHITIGNDVRIQAQSGISRNLKDGEKMQGSPALGYNDFNKSYVHFKNLPKLAKQVNELDKKVDK